MVLGYDRCSSPTLSVSTPHATAPNTEHRTYAELASAEKDAISHRGRAMERLEAELALFLVNE